MKHEFPDWQLDQIRDLTDVVTVAEELGLKLRRSGSSYVTSCPFHQERTPSFYITPAKAVWCCRGSCNEGGNIFQLVCRMTGKPFPEVVRELAARAGVHLDGASPQQKAPLRPITSRPKKVTDDVAVAPESVEARKRVYRFVLENTRLTEAGKRYMEDRGLMVEGGFRSIDHAGGWRQLGDTLSGEFTVDELLASGFWSRSDDAQAQYRAPWGGEVPALLIPYFGADYDDLIGIRWRRLNYNGAHKYHSMSGVSLPVPFNAPVIPLLGGCALNIVEGELNAWTLAGHDLYAIGIPGVGNWREEWGKLIRQARRILIWFDNDEAGKRAVHGFNRPDGTRVRGLLEKLRDQFGKKWVENTCAEVHLPAGKDANALHVAGELEAVIARIAQSYTIR